MARLTDLEIKNTVTAKGYKLIDATGYRNKQSFITLQCGDGHIFQTNLNTFTKSSFTCPRCIGAEIAVNSDNTLPPKTTYRIVAFDQASQKIGVSVYDKSKLVHYDLYEITGDFEVRLVKLYRFLTEVVIPEWKPDFLVFEDTQLQQNPTTFRMLSMVLGICTLAATVNNIPHETILNKVWQADFQILGSTRAAQKAAVIQRVKEYYNINVTDDVADAILIGRYAANRLSSKWEEDLF